MAEKKKEWNLAEHLKAVSDCDTGNREQLQYIDIGHILPDPENFYSMDGINDLAGSIELLGLQQPLRVRPGSGEGNYIIVSGHRRHAALKLLVKDGKEDFRLVPCLIDGREESEAMRKLRLIFANSGTRKLTPADLDKQAQEVEEALYKLKEEGTEFPGRMRDHVAQVCKVKASKLGELKVIREKLAGCWKPHFEAGELAQSSAYTLAGAPTEDQALIYRALIIDGKRNLKNLTNWDFEWALEAIEEIQPKTGSCEREGLDGSCLRKNDRLEKGIRVGKYTICAGCCAECYQIGSCDHVCPKCQDLAEQKKAEEKEKAKREADVRAAAEERKAARKAFNLSGWKRLGTAMDKAHKTGAWLAQTLDWDEDAGWVELLNGKDTEEDEYGWSSDHPLQDVDIKEVVDLADQLGTSLDYLMGRTDEPTGPEVSVPLTPQWQTGEPQTEGRYYCLVELEGEKMPMMLKWRGHDWGMAGGGGLNYGTVIGWWPLPGKDDEEDTDGEE